MQRVLLFTDEPVLARGLMSVIRGESGLSLNFCESIDELAALARAAAPCVVLIDWTRDVTFSLLSQMRRESPECPIVLWTRMVPTELAYQAIEAGVRGVLRKTVGTELLLRCLNRVGAGETWFDETLTASFHAAKTVSLTRRESQLVSLLAQGLKNKEISATLSISEGTVKVYLSRLFQKLGVKDRFELALYGLRNMQDGEAAASRRMHQPDSGVAAVPRAQPLRSILLDKPPEPQAVLRPRLGWRP